MASSYLPGGSNNNTTTATKNQSSSSPMSHRRQDQDQNHGDDHDITSSWDHASLRSLSSSASASSHHTASNTSSIRISQHHHGSHHHQSATTTASTTSISSSISHHRRRRQNQYNTLSTSLHEPLSKTLGRTSTHPPPHHHPHAAINTTTGPPSRIHLYGRGDWNDSINDMNDNDGDDDNINQVDPTTIYDYDYDVDDDDVSDIGSESDFTVDYSRHKLGGGGGGSGAPKGIGNLNDDDGDDDDDVDDDQSSLSSDAGSFANDEDYYYDNDNDNDNWSAASSSASSAADSRQLIRGRRQQTPRYYDDGDQQQQLQQQQQQLLLSGDDPTEFSVEEDPLFNASGTLRAFDLPPPTRSSQPKTVNEEDVWTEDEEEDFDSWVPHKVAAAAAVPAVSSSSLLKIWKETDQGLWVPAQQSDHHYATSSGNKAQPAPAPTTTTTTTTTTMKTVEHDFRLSSVTPSSRQSSIISNSSAPSTGSVESFAGEETASSSKAKSSMIKTTTSAVGSTTTIATSSSTIDSTAGAAAAAARPKMIPLKPDPRLKIDDSSDDEDVAGAAVQQEISSTTSSSKPLATHAELEGEVLVFSDDDEQEAGVNVSKATTASTTTGSTNTRTVVVQNEEDASSSVSLKKLLPPKPTPGGVAALIHRYSGATTTITPKNHNTRLSQRRSKHQNPIVPTPCPVIRQNNEPIMTTIAPDASASASASASSNILHQTAPPGHWTNEPPAEDPLQYSTKFSEFLRISPIEHRAPLKDHSKRPRKNRNRKQEASSKKKEKKSKKKKSSSFKTKALPETLQIVQSIEQSGELSSTNPASPSSGTEELIPDDGSVCSQDSNDSVDSAIGNKRKQSKMNNKKESKKKRKKDRVRKRGRRADYEEASSSEDDDLAHKAYAVADRVEAIFANPNMIFDTTIHDDQLTSFISSKYGFELSKPVSIRVKSQAAAEEPSKDETTRVAKEESSNPETIQVKSKDSEETEEESKSQRKSKSRGRSASTDRLKTSSSKGKSRSPKPESRSRSKSVKPELQDKNYDRSRSKSRDCPKKVVDRTKSDGALRRRVKKDSAGTTSLETDSADVVIPDLKPAKSSPSKRGKVEKEKEKPSKPKTSKSPTGSRKEVMASIPVQPSTTMTLQDLISQASIREDDSSVQEQQPMDIEEPAIEGTPVDVLRIKIQQIQKKLSDLEDKSKNDVELVRTNFLAQKLALEEKVRKENERRNPIEAILYLHKISVNDYHASGRVLKKEMKVIELEMTKEISRSIELTKAFQEWQLKTSSVLLTIQRLEFEKSLNMRTMQECQAEHHQLLVDSQRTLSYESSVIIGKLDDYALPSLVPLFQRWEQPSFRDVSYKVLADTYKLPKSSVFYNIFDDDDYKLTFTK